MQMQTMTWASPDTSVADRPDEARLVQRGLPLNCTVSLCPATSPARPRAGSNTGYHIAYAISNARSGYVSRVIALVPGSPRTVHHRRSGARPRYCNGGPHMFQMHYELASSQRYQRGPGETAHPLAWPGYRTQSIRDGTAMPGAPPYPAARLRTGPHSLTPMSYSGVGRGRRSEGSQAAGPPACPSPDVARTDEIPARQPGRPGREGEENQLPELRHGHNHPGTAQGQPPGAAARAAAGAVRPAGAAPRDSPAHCVYPE